MAGLTSTGFEAKRFNDILEAIKTRLRSTFGSGIDTNEDEIVMQIVNPVALEIEESWQGSKLLYDAMNPAAAEGPALDNVGAITATKRLEGSKSTVLVNATGNEFATIPVGFQRGVQDTGELFENLILRTLPAVGSQPLQFTMESIDEGPIAAIANTLNQGSLPSGITDVVNPGDATLGTLDETDEEYRISRKVRLQALGAGTVVSIKAALLEVSGVTSVSILENDTSLYDANGQAPHSIRCIILGGADQDIIDVIGATKAAGTGTVGTESGTFTDPVDSQTFPINFDRVTEIDIYVDVVVTSKGTSYPVTGDQDIEDAILALIWEPGGDVTLPTLQNAVTSIPGILAYTLFFDTSATPVVDVTISIDTDELADFDSTRIGVSS